MIGLPDRAAWRPLAGGSISAVHTAHLADGTAVVIKETPYPATIEADGLMALRDAGAPVPRVLLADGALMVLEHVSGEPDWAGLGRALADLHGHTGSAYGWHADNRIGSLVQANAPMPSWPAFYAERRVQPHLGAPALPGEVRRRIERGLERLVDLLPARPPASLVHGDLWSGNVVDGRWLIDPAVHHADREYELAFMDLFGGLPAAMWEAYLERAPLDEGWERRRPALQLHHLLVHVRLFGSGYVPAVTARLDALGW